MALPGLSLPGLSSTQPSELENSTPAAQQVRTQTLSPETELRFEASFASPITIRLLSGTAELFGTELAPSHPYTFRGTKAAIFTWHGCNIQITGTPEAEYIADETPMFQIMNLHFALEDLRAAAQQQGGAGPRVMVVGPENAGKTTLVKSLAAYALKSERQPIVVNLDPRQGLLSMPGALTATAVASVMDIEEGWGSSPISGPSVIPVKMPLSYHFGCQDPEENSKLFRPLITRLGLATTSRLEDDRETKVSGCLIDTAGALSSGKQGGYELIQHIASEFQVDVLIVIGSERLFSEMKRRFSTTGDSITVIRLDKSGGCVDRTEDYMKQLRQAQIKEYFYGHGGMSLSPFTQLSDFDHISIYRVNDTTTFSSAFDPGADDDDDEDYQPTPVSLGLHEKTQPSLMLQNSVVAVTHADANDSLDRIRDASVMWYMYVADVDESKRRLKLVSPISGPAPTNAQIWGPWPEGVPDLVA